MLISILWKKNKYIFSAVFVMFIALAVFFLYPKISDMITFERLRNAVLAQSAEAGVGCPNQYGGTRSVAIQCVITDNAGSCANCGQCWPLTGNGVCADYSEVSFAPAGGDGNFVCIPKTTKFFGGGNVLTGGQSIVTCSTGPALHYIVGLSPQ